MPAVLQTFSLIAIAVTLDAAALIVWNIGTRSPEQLARDLTRAPRSAKLANAVLRFFFGAACILCAALLIVVLLGRYELQLFPAFQIGAFIAALAVEHLLGEALRGGGSSTLTV